ncbi:HNH endonuclease [Rhizobium bangladeshense]|uniref:HNH endonuclease n=1 Tax=Rhizobium bangladeshense TaxID=1138189 RepID=UPI001C833159|nr:HNH endonuclease [Rhizobium bangladeshense]MBX4918373.1 HNH endonuclease [Rhizobium bangladeshense]
MGSLYLNGLNRDERAALEKQLWEQQAGKCFISGRPIEIGLDELDVDHIIPSRDYGKDDPTNFALTLASYNRSKQAADLRVARVLARFDQIKESADSDDRGANLNDVLKAYGGASGTLRGRISDTQMTYIGGGDDKVTVPIHTDRLSGMRYFFAVLPIASIHHDEKINPRPIGANVRGLVEEFFKGRPQLQVALGWINSGELPDARVNIFDGQHKAAAQILLGVTMLAVRVFIDPNFDILLTTNTNAGTTLRQVAFDKSVQRRLGSAMLLDRIARYRKDKGLPEDDESFSEKAIVEHFKGDQRAVTRYVLDGIRNAITYSPDNKLRDYIDNSGKGHEKPLSYSTIEKTFYSKFIGSSMLETPWNYRSDVGENPRTIEVGQIVRLMSLISGKIYQGKYDEEVGTAKLESKVQKGEDVPEKHLAAFRMAKEEIVYCWISYIGKIIENHFLMMGRVVDNQKLFQYPFPEQLWTNIGYFIDNLARLPMWVNRDASLTIFGGKQSYGFWQTIFESGSSPTGHKAMPSGLNIMEMIKP